MSHSVVSLRPPLADERVCVAADDSAKASCCAVALPRLQPQRASAATRDDGCVFSLEPLATTLKNPAGPSNEPRCGAVSTIAADITGAPNKRRSLSVSFFYLPFFFIPLSLKPPLFSFFFNQLTLVQRDFDS